MKPPPSSLVFPGSIPKTAQGSPICHGVSCFYLVSHSLSLSGNLSNSSCPPSLTVEQTKPNYSPWIISVVALIICFRCHHPTPKSEYVPSVSLLGTWFDCCFVSALINVSSFRKCSVAFISESRMVPGTMLWWFSQSGSSEGAAWINEWMHPLKWTKVTHTMFLLKTFTSSELSLKKSLRIRNRTWKLWNADFFFLFLL